MTKRFGEFERNVRPGHSPIAVFKDSVDDEELAAAVVAERAAGCGEEFDIFRMLLGLIASSSNTADGGRRSVDDIVATPLDAVLE